ncbi:MAG: hypothetical protein ACRDXX_13355 [Stackebrandtia sp.]
MTDFNPPVPAAGKQRPTTVTVAAILTFATAALMFVNVALNLAYGQKYADAMRENLEGQGVPEADIDQVAQSGAELINIAPSIVLALALCVLAYFFRNGSNGARIATWVVGGLTAVCLDIGAATLGAGGALMGMAGDELGYDLESAAEAGAEATGPLYTVFPIITMIVGAVSVLTALVLLMLSSSNEYFRKAPPQVTLPPEAG